VPITVTSHFHFLEVNPRLSFDREAAYGRHLDIAAGSSVTFEPGEALRVAVVPIRGERVVIGMAGFVDGPLDAPGAKERALDLLRATGFLDSAYAGGSSDPEGAVGRVRQHLAAHPEVQS
jgi:urease subunit gamma/beta